MKNFITPEELNHNLTQYVIIDCRGEMGAPAVGRAAYEKSRIPGAHFIPFDALYAPVASHGGRHPLPCMETFVATIAQFGLHNDTPVVIYDDWGGAMGRLWWMLTYVGITNVKVLRGGFPRWLKGGFPVETGDPTAMVSEGSVTYHPREDLLVTMDTVRDIIKTQEAVLLDVRQGFRYRGESEPLDAVAGHIPTALNCFYEDFYNHGDIASMEVIESLLGPVKAKNKPIITYCGSGITAPIALLAMNEAGIAPVLYVGSFSDWISYEDNDVAIGEEI